MSPNLLHPSLCTVDSANWLKNKVKGCATAWNSGYQTVNLITVNVCLDFILVSIWLFIHNKTYMYHLQRNRSFVRYENIIQMA